MQEAYSKRISNRNANKSLQSKVSYLCQAATNYLNNSYKKSEFKEIFADY